MRSVSRSLRALSALCLACEPFPSSYVYYFATTEPMWRPVARVSGCHRATPAHGPPALSSLFAHSPRYASHNCVAPSPRSHCRTTTGLCERLRDADKPCTSPGPRVRARTTQTTPHLVHVAAHLRAPRYCATHRDFRARARTGLRTIGLCEPWQARSMLQQRTFA